MYIRPWIILSLWKLMDKDMITSVLLILVDTVWPSVVG